MSKLVRFSDRVLNAYRYYEHLEDFKHYVTTDMFTSVLTDSGTAAVSAAANGILTITASDGTVADNDEAYVATTNEVFLFANDKPFVVESLVKFAEANTDDANIFFGLADAIAANTLVDDGAGLKTSFSGACIYKVDGSNVWKCISSVGTTQTITTSTLTAGGSSYQRLKIEVNPISTTNVEISFFVDGIPLYDAAVTSKNQAIKHVVDATSATEMDLGWGVKNGGANNESLNVDYVAWAGVR